MIQLHDIVGDVHGRADALHRLLSLLGYQRRGANWFHNEGRQLIFVGDLIDVGPEQRETLQTVRALMDCGIAQAIMGNHEFNAICYATPDTDSPGDYLRSHGEPWGEHNRQQHEAFLKEFASSPEEHREWIDWMLALPLWIETAAFRVVHACWNQHAIDCLSEQLPSKRLSVSQLRLANDNAAKLGEDVSTLLKGPEVRLPANLTFADRSGHSRDHVRLAWWRTNAQTYGKAALWPQGVTPPAPDELLPSEVVSHYNESKPTFFGHYCLQNAPVIVGWRTACLDTCAAREHKLTAYRWEGEPDLTAEHVVQVAISG